MTNQEWMLAWFSFGIVGAWVGHLLYHLVGEAATRLRDWWWAGRK